jgi:hypothetical protein
MMRTHSTACGRRQAIEKPPARTRPQTGISHRWRRSRNSTQLRVPLALALGLAETLLAPLLATASWLLINALLNRRD